MLSAAITLWTSALSAKPISSPPQTKSALWPGASAMYGFLLVGKILWGFFGGLSLICGFSLAGSAFTG